MTKRKDPKDHLPSGRPLNFKSREELDEAINKYLEHVKEIDGVLTEKGFCHFHNITSDWLSENKERPIFCQSIKALKERCETYLAENALKNKINATMSIFLLKNNHGYSDKIESKNDNTNINMNYQDFKKKLAEERRKAKEEKK